MAWVVVAGVEVQTSQALEVEVVEVEGGLW